MAPNFEIPGFEIQEELGRGGFGVVYRAYEPALRRDVAIKVLHASSADTDLQRRFQRECGIVGSLRAHPHIVTVHSAGQTETGYLYLVMEYLPAGSLAARMPLPPDEVRELGLKLASALDSAHRSNVRHLDVKPGNVMFNSDDEPVLVDFGIAVMTGDSTTTSRSITASIGYAPPEVLNGERGGESADVYGAGATLCAALTGKTPFHEPGLSLSALIARVATTPASQQRPADVPDALWSIIEKAMAKSPADRFPSMAALHAALLADEVVAAPLGGSDVTARGNAADVTAPTPATALAKEETAPVLSGAVTVRRRRRALVPAAAAALLLGGGAVAAVAMAGGEKPRALTPAGTTSSSAPSSSTSSSSGAPKSSAKPTAKTSAKATGPVRTSGTAAGGTMTGATTAGSGPAEVPPGQTATSPAPVVQQPGRTTTRATTAAPAANRAPTFSVANRANDEQQSVGFSFDVSDPDGDSVSVSVSGLPAGVGASGGSVSGTVSYNAASVTTDRRSGIASRAFTVTVTATDSRGARTTKSFTWTVRDTHRTMPYYVGTYGCGGCQSAPDIAAISIPDNRSACDPSSDRDLIWQQGVKAGSVIRWGQSITYWYGLDPANPGACENVAGG